MRRIGLTITSAAVTGALCLGLPGGQVFATPSTSAALSSTGMRAADPAKVEARQQLRASVEAAWQEFVIEISRAKAARRAALRAPRADLADALTSAGSRDERTSARQAFARTAAAPRAAYRGARAEATKQRIAAVDRAVDAYLDASGQGDVATAARRYRAAVAQADDTLRLALASSRASFRTDTADEREELTIALAGASTNRARDAAWRDFQEATADERAALRAATAAARATERSAVTKAARQFRSRSGHSVGWLAALGERS